MAKRVIIFFIILFTATLLTDCAKRGMPEGGPIDSIPPVITRTAPENYSTHFNENEIRIYFNEYIKFKELQKQLIISPPLENQPIITPFGVAKEIRIVFEDTLKENTTYSINFGESIVDNNEDNPYDFYKYVFSTGSYIDSLAISGTIKDAKELHPEEAVTVMLYAVDDSYTDSMVYNQKPLYVTTTLKDPNLFSIENIKEGKYKLIALKDKNRNFTFDPKDDKIGFIDGFIEVPADSSSYQLTLFKEIPEFKPARPKQVSNNQIIFGYEGNADAMKIELLTAAPEDFKYTTLKDQKKDTIHYWFRPQIEKDTLQFVVRNNNALDTLILRMNNINRDSIAIKPAKTGTLNFDEDFILECTTPIAEFTKEKVSIINKDSLAIPFEYSLDSIYNRLHLSFEKQEREIYNITLLPDAIVDFFDKSHDTLNFKASTKTIADYGFLTFQTENISEYPIIVQLVAERGGEIHKEVYATEQQEFVFENINPGKYYVRIVFDQNANGVWDTGNFLKKTQPEKVVYYPTLLDIRANWSLHESFILDP